MLVYGAKRFDQHYGSKTNAYSVWQAAKKLAGYYVNGELAGVGYTTGGMPTLFQCILIFPSQHYLQLHQT